MPKPPARLSDSMTWLIAVLALGWAVGLVVLVTQCVPVP